MYVRVVRFTDVTADRIDALKERITEGGGPPPGVDSTGVTALFDEAQGTAVILGYFETSEAMEEAAAVFSAMDPADTPGTRASVDQCEVLIEMSA